MIKTKFALLLPIFLSIVTIFSYFTPESLARSEDYIYSSVYEQVTPSIVAIEANLERGVSSGTGCIISPDGVILTSLHVVNKAKNIEITISGVGDIYNINNKIDIQDYKEINKIEKAWSSSLKKDLTKVIKKVQSKWQADIFGFGNLIYKNNPKTWKKQEKNWNSKYFPNLNIKVKTDLKIDATGSLINTIKEDK